MKPFFSPLYNMTNAGGRVTTFPPYSAAQTWMYSNSYSSFEMPQKSGTRVSSSNVDKRIWLIPCRCVSEPLGGNTVLPSPRRERPLRGERSTSYEWKTSVTGSSWFWLSAVPGKREERSQEQTHSFHSLGKCWYAESHDYTLTILLAKNEITYWPKTCIQNCEWKQRKCCISEDKTGNTSTEKLSWFFDSV